MNLLAVATISLAAMAADSDLAGPWKLTLKPRVGQEVIFRGAVTDTKTADGGARFEQSYTLEATMFVIDISPKGTSEIGCYTVMRTPDHRTTPFSKQFDNVVSAHFGMMNLDESGRPTWATGEAAVALPPDGAAPWEAGYLIEMPNKPVGPSSTWTLKRAGQQPTNCRVYDMENVAGTPCVKVVAIQTSQNWDNKNVAIPAWTTQTVVWIDPKEGMAQRVQRTHQVREPGDLAPSRTVVAKYDQFTSTRYHGELYQQRVADFRTGLAAQGHLEKTLAETERVRQKQLVSLRESLQTAMADKLYSTPYRPAIERVIKIATQQEKADDEAAPAPVIGTGDLVIGKKARNFVVRTVDKNETISLKKVKGRNVLLVYVDPGSSISRDALRDSLEAVGMSGMENVDVYAVAVEGDEKAIESMKNAVPGKYVVCNGAGGERGYGTDALPHAILIDVDGIIRSSQVGYGRSLSAVLRAGFKTAGGAAESVGGKHDAKPSYLR